MRTFRKGKKYDPNGDYVVRRRIRHNGEFVEPGAEVPNLPERAKRRLWDAGKICLRPHAIVPELTVEFVLRSWEGIRPVECPPEKSKQSSAPSAKPQRLKQEN